MKMKKIKSCFLFFLIGFAFSPLANAAKTAQVIVPNANVYLYPQPQSKVLSTLPQGSAIAISNLPTEGFYKVRLASGDIGWISGNDVLAGDAPAAQAVPAPKRKNNKSTAKRDASEDDQDDTVRALFGYGIQSLSYSGLKDNITNTTSLNLGKQFGIELQFRMSEQVYWGIRVEVMSASTGSKNIAGGTQTVDVKEIPVQLGMIWSPVSTHSFRFGLGGYLGAVPSASTTIVQTLAAVDTVQYQSTELCATLATQASIGLGDLLGIFVDLAYRYDKTGTNVATSVSANGFSIDYSGITARLGLEFRL